jgi:hypothetical protein
MARTRRLLVAVLTLTVLLSLGAAVGAAAVHFAISYDAMFPMK